MTRFAFTLFLCLLCFGSVFAQKKGKKGQEFKGLTSQQDSIGYAIGMDIAQRFKEQGIEVGSAAFFKGFEDAYTDQKLLLTDVQTQQLFMDMQARLQAKAEQERNAKATTNLERGQKFLAENKTKPGVIELPNGLQYIVIKEGTGASPSLTDEVTTHYHGTFINGEVFDSSVNRGEPATFAVNQVIQAWQTILPMMKEGGKVKIFSPSNLAYGPNGMGNAIGPNEVLVFEIELIKVKR